MYARLTQYLFRIEDQRRWVDNLATHKHPAVRSWLERHPRVTLHFTPTSGSWLNLVEAFFSIITRQALRRGNFPTVADLIAAIERFIDAWNDRCRPFTWTKDPDTVIAKASDPRRRKTLTTSDTEHYRDLSAGVTGRGQVLGRGVWRLPRDLRSGQALSAGMVTSSVVSSVSSTGRSRQRASTSRPR